MSDYFLLPITLKTYMITSKLQNLFAIKVKITFLRLHELITTPLISR